ncbi:hypothetical protein BKP35_16535 [Anaerobacillus arseniciselenatis]|uniref:Uncharacterized protein n=1 Tax=Anaerobacillus arseniciselenatis TaxID=85682 RepID=A0A1S2LAP4_9BACI|nr:hypothetical protein [Anaerobacillus arseniciselenatis]OIJ09461.1 hypothetical protein BKP35_16535 [Anaerobacillus arseniciselenatis]
MGKLFVLYLVFPLMLIILHQPTLNTVEETRGNVAKVAIERATEFASVEGYYTEEIKKEVYTLLGLVGYTEDNIELFLTEDITFRGDYIEGGVKVPNLYTNVLITNILDPSVQEQLYHVHYSSRMSEYVN